VFGHCHGHPFDFAHAPVFLAGVAAGDGMNMVDTELFEVANLGTRVLPLLPDKARLRGFKPIVILQQAMTMETISLRI
jgi:hypothetical protein